jgi:hypothetical protein
MEEMQGIFKSFSSRTPEFRHDLIFQTCCSAYYNNDLRSVLHAISARWMPPIIVSGWKSRAVLRVLETARELPSVRNGNYLELIL